MTISSLLENAKVVQSGLQGSLVREVLQMHGTEIVEQQRIQLLEGKNSHGEDTVSYTHLTLPTKRIV